MIELHRPNKDAFITACNLLASYSRNSADPDFSDRLQRSEPTLEQLIAAVNYTMQKGMSISDAIEAVIAIDRHWHNKLTGWEEV